MSLFSWLLFWRKKWFISFWFLLIVLFVWGGHFFGKGQLLEHGHLFIEEIRYSVKVLSASLCLFSITNFNRTVMDETVHDSIQENLVFFPLVYDTSSRETFEKLEEWLNEIEMYSTKKDIIKMLVGNKIDKVQWNLCVFILDQIIITQFLLLKTGVFSLNLNLEIKWISY